jgi:DNA-3-methyladenine glycosylase II
VNAAIELTVSLVTFGEPIDIGASLELFRRSGDDFLDRWDGARLVRVLRFGPKRVPFVGTLDGTALRVSPATDEVLAAAARTFFLAPPGFAELLVRDPVLAALHERFPGVRQPRQLDLFTALVRCVSAQQVNLRWAVITRRRLAECFGVRHEVEGHVVYTLEPEPLAGVAPEQIRVLQFTTSKARSIVAVAQAMVEGHLSLEELALLPDEEVIARLTAIRGIGRWSAEWILARTLGRPRVVAGDLGVRKAVGLAYLGTPLPTESHVREVIRHWGESSGVAQAMLLHALGEGGLVP